MTNPECNLSFSFLNESLFDETFSSADFSLQKHLNSSTRCRPYSAFPPLHIFLCLKLCDFCAFKAEFIMTNALHCWWVSFVCRHGSITQITRCANVAELPSRKFNARAAFHQLISVIRVMSCIGEQAKGDSKSIHRRICTQSHPTEP